MLKNNRGVALLMVMGTITILTALLADFTFETKVNKLRILRGVDKVQAEMNARAGLELALARLRMYREALNLLEKKQSLKKNVPMDALNNLWAIPFLYPIPIGKDADLVMKTAIKDFEKNSLVQGEMRVVISKTANKINVNLLRIEGMGDETVKNLHIEKTLIKMLERELDSKKEIDDDFDLVYGNLEPELLVKTLRFMVSDQDSYLDDRSSEVETLFEDVPPKFAPLSTFDEISMVPGWNDAVLNLVRENITVYGVQTIDLNKIGAKFLKVLVPEIEKEDIKIFLKYRDDPEDPHPMENEKVFIDYITGELQLVEAETLEERMKEFKKAGISFGQEGNLFEVESVGSFNQASVTLTAIVLIPPKEAKKEKKVVPNEKGECPKGTKINEKKDQCVKVDKDGKKIKEPRQYKTPRVVDIKIQ